MTKPLTLGINTIIILLIHAIVKEYYHHFYSREENQLKKLGNVSTTDNYECIAGTYSNEPEYEIIGDSDVSTCNDYDLIKCPAYSSITN